MSTNICQCLSAVRAALRQSAKVTSPSTRHVSRTRLTGSTTRRCLTNTTLRLAKSAKSASRGAPVPPPVRQSAAVAGADAPLPGLATRLERFFASGDKVLLYKSPSHTAFYIYSYLVGGGLIFGAYNYAAVVLQPLPGEDAPRPLPKWVKYITVGTAVFIAGFGTVVMLAPVRLLKTITAVAKRTPGSNVIQPHLIVEIKAPLPFIPAKTIEVPASQAFLNLELAAVQMRFANVPPTDAAAFTDDYLKNRGSAPPIRTGSRLANLWPMIRYETRRLILREGFARLRFATRGSFKVDLHDCELLDNGRPLSLFTTPDLTPRGGSMATLRRLIRD